MVEKNNVIMIYVRKDQINFPIITRIAEGHSLIPKHGFKYIEEDVSHDYKKQKELHEVNGTREYPLFEYCKDNENIYRIGNLEALREWLTSPPLYLQEEEVQEEDIDSLLADNENTKNDKDNKVDDSKVENGKVVESNEEVKEEEEKEPSLGIISQSLQTVEGVVKYSTSWFTSWFYTPPTISPLSSDNVNNNNDNNNNENLIANAENNNVDIKSDDNNNNNNNLKGEEEGKKEGDGKEEEDVRDFKVVQTNWYWRQQNRVIRFDIKNKTMYRYDPLDLSIRAIHPFSLLKDVTCYTSQCFFQLTFQKTENDPATIYEYYTTSSTDFPLILSLLATLSPVAANVLA